MASPCRALPCLALPCPGLSGNVAPLIGPVLPRHANPRSHPAPIPGLELSPQFIYWDWLCSLFELPAPLWKGSLFYTTRAILSVPSTQLNSTQLHLTSNSSIPTLKIYSHACCWRSPADPVRQGLPGPHCGWEAWWHNLALHWWVPTDIVSHNQPASI